MLLGEKLRHKIGDLDVVEVGEREMSIAPNTDFRQMHNRGIAAVALDRLEYFEM